MSGEMHITVAMVMVVLSLACLCQKRIGYVDSVILEDTAFFQASAILIDVEVTELRQLPKSEVERTMAFQLYIIDCKW